MKLQSSVMMEKKVTNTELNLDFRYFLPELKTVSRSTGTRYSRPLLNLFRNLSMEQDMLYADSTDDTGSTQDEVSGPITASTSTNQGSFCPLGCRWIGCLG